MNLDDWKTKIKLDENNNDLVFPEFLIEFPNLKFTTSPTADGLVMTRAGTLEQFKDLLIEKSEK